MGGRPHQVNVRVDEDERALLRRAARKAIRDVSDWARIVLLDRARAELGGADPVRPPDPEEAAALAWIRRLEALDPALVDALQSLGDDAKSRPHLVRALKELAAAVHEGGPHGSDATRQKGPPRRRHTAST